MADVINMPKLGFDMAEGTLVRWVKKEGDAVEAGELLAEIETDKATVEVESQYSGIVHKHLVAEGAAVPVGQSIAVVGSEGEEIDVDRLVSSASDGEDDKPQESQPKEAEEPVEAVQESPGQVVDQATRRLLPTAACPTVCAPARWPAASPRTRAPTCAPFRAAGRKAASLRRMLKAS